MFRLPKYKVLTSPRTVLITAPVREITAHESGSPQTEAKRRTREPTVNPDHDDALTSLHEIRMNFVLDDVPRSR